MEALKAYNSDSDNDENDTDHVLQTETGKYSSDNLSKRVQIQTENESKKRKPVAGYVSKRKCTRHIGIQQAEFSNMVSTSCIDISSYLSSSTKREHKQKRCMVPGSVPCLTFSQHTKPVLGLNWHPSDDRLLLSCSLDGTVRLWDALWQKVCLATYTMQDSIPIKRSLWIDNNTIVYGGYDNYAFHVDVESGRILSKLKHNSYVTALAIHPEDPNFLLSGNSKSEIHRWDLRCCEDVKTYNGAAGQILDILFLKGGEQFVASSDIERKSGYSQAMNVWDYTSGVVLAGQIYFEPYSCPFLRLHPIETVFLAQSSANYLTVFSSNKPYKLNKFKRFEGHSLQGNNVGFDLSNDGSIVCSASANGTVIFYDYSSTKILKSVPLATSSTICVEWHPHLYSTVAVSSWNGEIFTMQ